MVPMAGRCGVLGNATVRLKTNGRDEQPKLVPLDVVSTGPLVRLTVSHYIDEDKRQL